MLNQSSHEGTDTVFVYTLIGSSCWILRQHLKMRYILNRPSFGRPLRPAEGTAPSQSTGVITWIINNIFAQTKLLYPSRRNGTGSPSAHTCTVSSSVPQKKESRAWRFLAASCLIFHTVHALHVDLMGKRKSSADVCLSVCSGTWFFYCTHTLQKTFCLFSCSDLRGVSERNIDVA